MALVGGAALTLGAAGGWAFAASVAGALACGDGAGAELPGAAGCAALALALAGAGGLALASGCEAGAAAGPAPQAVRSVAASNRMARSDEGCFMANFVIS
ncbi:MAG: hypothetical protein ACHQ7M_04265 [Chloroflexota bacterium]